MPQTGVAQLDGFAESLRLLLVEEQYTMHDISLMFGVTGERIRQLANQHGLQERPKHGGLNCVRVWHDGERRFRPVHKRILRQLETRNRVAQRRQKRDAKYEARWQHAIAKLRDLARILGRTPTVLELARSLGLGPNPGLIVSYLLQSSHRRTGSSLAPLWRAAGLSPNPVGSPGHTRGGHRTYHRTTHCRRGHERTPENTYTYLRDGRERQRCRMCKRQGA